MSTALSPATVDGHRGRLGQTAPATRVLLTDGSSALVRPLGPDVAVALLELHERLPDHDRYLRFSTLHPADLPGYVQRTLAPGSGAVSLGAWVRGQLIGAVQLLPLGGDSAEVAAVVDQEWRQHGVATVLLEELAEHARRAGITRLVAEVLAENGRMLRVLSELGLPLGVTRERGSLRVEIGLHADDRYTAATERRHRRAAGASLAAVLRPDTVAVIGAGRREGSVGRAVLRSLSAAGFAGQIFAVHPSAARLEGVPGRPTVGAVPGTVDLAVICVPAAAVAQVVEECGDGGVRALLMITSGLAAIPGLPERVRDLTERYGMRMIGPNSVGVVGPGTATRLDATFAGQRPPPGDIGLVAQSGGIVIAAVQAWARLGLGVSAVVSTGDAYDVGPRDVLAWFDEDPGTELVVLYAESEPDLRALARAARHLALRVPVLALRSGTSSAGRRAAASHTARAATPQAVREAAYATGGIQSVADLTCLAAAVGLLRGQPLPPRLTVAVLANVGGGGVLVADACVAAGLAVDVLPELLQQQLHAVLPPQASVGNPIDTGAAVTAEAFGAALGLLLDDPAVGAVVTVTAPTAVSDPAPGVAHAVAAHGAAGGQTPVIDVRLGQAPSVTRLELPGAPDGRFLVSVADPVTAARALSVAYRRRAWLDRPPGTVVIPPGVDIPAARAAITAALARSPGGDWLRPPEADALCRAAGLPLVASHWVSSAEQAVAAATAVGAPVAVKGFADGVLHKGDAGLVRLEITDPAEVGRSVADWRDRTGSRWRGALVQPMIPAGDELLVGGLRDAEAGPVVAVGPGGRAADALGHRVHRLAPLTDVSVEEMLDGTGLFGTGHGRQLDRAGVTDALLRVSWLVDALPEVVELDVNPLVVTPERSLALDVRVRVAPERATAP